MVEIQYELWWHEGPEMASTKEDVPKWNEKPNYDKWEWFDNAATSEATFSR